MSIGMRKCAPCVGAFRRRRLIVQQSFDAFHHGPVENRRAAGLRNRDFAGGATLVHQHIDQGPALACPRLRRGRPRHHWWDWVPDRRARYAAAAIGKARRADKIDNYSGPRSGKIAGIGHDRWTHQGLECIWIVTRTQIDRPVLREICGAGAIAKVHRAGICNHRRVQIGRTGAGGHVRVGHRVVLGNRVFDLAFAAQFFCPRLGGIEGLSR